MRAKQLMATESMPGRVHCQPLHTGIAYFVLFLVLNGLGMRLSIASMPSISLLEKVSKLSERHTIVSSQ